MDSDSDQVLDSDVSQQMRDGFGRAMGLSAVTVAPALWVDVLMTETTCDGLLGAPGLCGLHLERHQRAVDSVHELRVHEDLHHVDKLGCGVTVGVLTSACVWQSCDCIVRRGTCRRLHSTSATCVLCPENHPTDTAHEDSLIIKTCVFQMVNSYFALFYIGACH